MPGCGFSILPNRQLGKGVNVSELGERDCTFAAETVDILTESLNDVGAEVAATVLAPGVHRRGEVRERADLMEAARNAGREMIQG